MINVDLISLDTVTISRKIYDIIFNNFVNDLDLT